MDELLLDLLDPLFLEFVYLGFGLSGNPFGVGEFFESPLRLVKDQGDTLMGLRRLDRKLLGDWGDRYFVFEVPSNDCGFLLSSEFSTCFANRNPTGNRLC